MTGNISDIVSMGGDPLLAMVSLGIPDDWEEESVLGAYRGMLEACSESECVIAGGDISGAENLILNIALYGECSEREPVYRNGASTGDYIYVTGSPGGSLAGLEILKSGSRELMEKYKPLVDTHRRPSCRYDIMKKILEVYKPTAMIDISDGLLSDLGHICSESGRGFSLQKERLPVSGILSEYCNEKKKDPYDLLLTGGEEYQLLFTSALSPEEIPESKTGDAVCIGKITGNGYTLEISGNKREISPAGFDHFKKGKGK
jgi:thiamine-monophosphate kinase